MRADPVMSSPRPRQPIQPGENVFPALGIRRELPEGKPVTIELPELKAGEYEFKCGMDMIKGKLVVRPRG
jgi:plastocyanin domain-containing protein